jgi:hypothetical protein
MQHVAMMVPARDGVKVAVYTDDGDPHARSRVATATLARTRGA